jgi:DNA-binding NarL/FixJ family response regulator
MVVDDHPVWRDGVRADLTTSGAVTVVGEASDVEEAVWMAGEVRPDLVVMDLQLGDGSGVDATRLILARTPEIKVIVLSAFGDEADVLEAVKAGACGYLLKTATAAELVDAVLRACAGDAVFSPPLASLILDEFRRTAAAPAADPKEPTLTARENEVLALVARGYSNNEIADRLVISPHTVQTHVQNILEKLHLKGRYALMRHAIREGLDRDDVPES